jgi:Outer membrane protein beta-barrel domain
MAPTSFLSLACLSVAFALSGAAQESLRSSMAGARAAEERRRALENQPYNLKLGPVNLLASASLSVELNDNVNLAQVDRRDDLILRSQLDVYGLWPVTPHNALNLTLGVGYAKYFNQSQYDHLVVRPGSELSFDLFVRDFKITLYDRFSYTQDPVSQGSISGEAEFGGFYNTAGAGVNWDLNEMILSFGYDHYNFLSSVERFDYLNRRSDSVLARATFLPQTALHWGFEAGGALNNYDQHVLNDNRSYNVGAFLDWTISSHLRLQPRAGFVQYSFDSGGLVGDTPDEQSYYFTLGVEHEIGKSAFQTLDAGRSLDLGINADLVDLWHVRYLAELRIIRKLGLEPHLFFERGRETGRLLAETFNRFGGGIGFNFQLMEKLQTRLRYSLTIKDSDLPLRDYTQHVVALEASRRF